MTSHAVFDCMIYLQAASKPYRTHGPLDAVSAGELKLFISPDIVAEVNDVLNRPKLQRQFPALTPESI